MLKKLGISDILIGVLSESKQTIVDTICDPYPSVYDRACLTWIYKCTYVCMHKYNFFFLFFSIIVIQIVHYRRNHEQQKSLEMSSKIINKAMDNIEIDHFGFSTDRMATVGVGPCICFIIILKYIH